MYNRLYAGWANGYCVAGYGLSGGVPVYLVMAYEEQSDGSQDWDCVYRGVIVRPNETPWGSAQCAYYVSRNNLPDAAYIALVCLWGVYGTRQQHAAISVVDLEVRAHAVEPQHPDTAPLPGALLAAVDALLPELPQVLRTGQPAGRADRPMVDKIREAVSASGLAEALPPLPGTDLPNIPDHRPGWCVSVQVANRRQAVFVRADTASEASTRGMMSMRQQGAIPASVLYADEDVHVEPWEPRKS